MESNLPSIFKKIELLLIFDENNKIATTKVEFENARMKITNNHLIIITETTDGELKTETGKLFALKEIGAYKTYRGKITLPSTTSEERE